ncbi:hypothetical protein Phi2_0013 [Vibrio phage phi 2]|uniref:Arc-like repressor n=1 Tax=Vibrio phage X29 TaxID=1500713 RepID=UPI00045FDDCA|nr:Arc-like repressor [Vibrio phage X29]AHN84822.1 hypothetical protein Phi2_0013 [Vibrio phage phi 2]AIA10337.1 hypothetical protein SBVcX29_0058 [Vibrio phage X29]
MIIKAAKTNTTFFGQVLRLGKDFLVVEDDDQKGLEAAKAEIEAGNLVEATEEEVSEVEDSFDLESMDELQLKELAKQLKIKGYSSMKRETLIAAIEANTEEAGE